MNRFALILLFSLLTLAGCSTETISPKKSAQPTALGEIPPPAEPTEAIGLKSMDENDKGKMSHALDKPLGKSTEWTSTASGIKYAVTPTDKLTVNGNPFCRAYSVTVSKGTYSRTLSGKACVSSEDSSWRVVE